MRQKGCLVGEQHKPTGTVHKYTSSGTSTACLHLAGRSAPPPPQYLADEPQLAFGRLAERLAVERDRPVGPRSGAATQQAQQAGRKGGWWKKEWVGGAVQEQKSGWVGQEP